MPRVRSARSAENLGRGRESFSNTQTRGKSKVHVKICGVSIRGREKANYSHGTYSASAPLTDTRYGSGGTRPPSTSVSHPSRAGTSEQVLKKYRLLGISSAGPWLSPCPQPSQRRTNSTSSWRSSAGCAVSSLGRSPPAAPLIYRQHSPRPLSKETSQIPSPASQPPRKSSRGPSGYRALRRPRPGLPAHSAPVRTPSYTPPLLRRRVDDEGGVGGVRLGAVLLLRVRRGGGFPTYMGPNQGFRGPGGPGCRPIITMFVCSAPTFSGWL